MPKDLQGKKSDSCEGMLSNNDGIMTAERLRQIFGLCAKYILLPKDWDYQGPLHLRTFHGISFDVHPFVASMSESFSSRTAEQMKRKTPLNDCLRWLVGYSEGISNPKCKLKTRKKRLTRVARDFRKRLRGKNMYDRKSAQGIMIFTISVKRQFLGRGDR